MTDQTLPDFDKLWNYGDPAASEAAFRELLPRAEAAGDADYLAALRSQIARTHSLRRNFDEAHALLDQAEQTASAPVARARCLMERGRCFNSAGEPTRAVPLFIEAHALACEGEEDYHAIDAAHMVAIAGTPAEQLAWAGKALEHVERTECERARGWAGPLYNNLGWTYHDQEQYEQALACFQKGLAVREAAGKQEPIFIARWTIGRVLRSLDRLEEALAHQRALLADREAAGTESGYVHEELGECLLALDRGQEAAPHFVEAHRLLSQDSWLVNNEPKRIKRLQELADA